MNTTNQTQAAPKSPVATLCPGFTENANKATHSVYGMPSALTYEITVKDHADKFFLFTHLDVWSADGWLVTSVHEAQGLYVMQVRKGHRVGTLVAEGDSPLWHQSKRADHALKNFC